MKHAVGLVALSTLAACAQAPDAATAPAARGALSLLEATSAPIALVSCVPSPTATPGDFYPGDFTTTIVSGMVCDVTGQPVDGAVVVAKSLDQSVPYTASATSFQGQWVINSIPEGANMEFMATKDGLTSTLYVGAYHTRSRVKNTLNLVIEAFPELPADPTPNPSSKP